MKSSTRENYRVRILRVMDHIHQHWDGDLQVDELAGIALMSPYHFHRIYRELARETVAQTVRRIRLHRAAVELIRSNTPIESIATRIHYGSTEAFTRAFTSKFGQGPGAYRQQKQREDNGECEPFIAALPDQPREYTDMYDVTIEPIAKMNLIGLRHTGDYLEIGKKFEALFIEAGTKQLLNQDTRSIGLYYDDPQSVDKDKLRSIACITDNTNSDNTNGFEKVTIPHGNYACLLFKGAYAELEKPYNWLFGKWLPESGHEADDFPVFEEYLNDPKTTPPAELLTRIHCKLV